jgi:3-oxoacyl-[acyl-carrier protein] reductase
MDMGLRDRSVIVTGASRGIGRAIAEAFAAEGARLTIVARTEADIDAAAEAIRNAHEGTRVQTVTADVTAPADAARIIEAAVGAHGGVDVLVNNAGGLIARKTISEMSLAHWQAVMDLNLTSVFLMVKACLPYLKSGAIVNIASQAARDGGGSGAVAYATSKGAVMTMTRGLAKELGPDIRVNALCPGMIDTDFHNVHTPDAGRRGFEAAVPLKRQGHTNDVANLVLFLACEDSAFITGANIDINGGMVFS